MQCVRFECLQILVQRTFAFQCADVAKHALAQLRIQGVNKCTFTIIVPVIQNLKVFGFKFQVKGLFSTLCNLYFSSFFIAVAKLLTMAKEFVCEWLSFAFILKEPTFKKNLNS